jgi:NAD(P)H-flavin reductase
MRYDPGFSQGRVTAIRDAARGVREIEIAPERGALPYAAGSHIDLRVPLEHFPAKWMPVCVAKMRPDKEIEPRSDSIGTEKALGGIPAISPSCHVGGSVERRLSAEKAKVA